MSIPVRTHKKKSIFSRVIRRLKRPFALLSLKLNIKYRILSRLSPVNTPGGILWVDPNRILETSLNYDSKDVLRSLGGIRGGDWDKKRMKFDDFELYKALRLHFEQGVSLSETPFYDPAIATKEQFKALGGSRIWEFITAYEYEERSRRIGRLYASIQDNGYLTQRELGGIYGDEIKVNISREGDLLFVDGIHRLAIAKILGLRRIPVVVIARHAVWNAFKNQVIAYAQKQQVGTDHEGELYQKLHHSDMEDVAYVHENDDRFQAMKAHLMMPRGTLLDIGANFGYFCHCFEELGFDCTAVEYDPELAYFLIKLKRAEQRRFEVISKNILDMYLKPLKYDVVLALNIFHHFLKTKQTYLGMIRMLRNLRAKQIFFEPHNPAEGAFGSSYINLSNDEFVDFIKVHSGLCHSEMILDCIEGRQLFSLWR